MERSIEIMQPSKSWWIKQLIIHLMITLLFTPIIFYILLSSGEGINNCLLYKYCLSGALLIIIIITNFLSPSGYLMAI